MEVHADRVRRLFEQVMRKARRGIKISRTKGFAGLDPFHAIGAEDGGAHGQRGFVVGGEHGDGAVAIAAKGQQQRAFGADGSVAGLVVNGGKPCAHVGAAFKAFYADGALRRGGHPFGFRKWLSDAGFAKSLQASGGKQSDVCLTGFELGKARGDVAAKADDGKVRAGVEHKRGTARGAGADARAGWDGLDGGRAYQYVAHVGTRKYGSNHEFFRADGFNIFHRMHCKIDFTCEQPRIQFFGPQRLAADFGKGAVQDLVATGRDGDQFDHGFGPAVGSTKARSRLVSLRHGEGRAARAEL